MTARPARPRRALQRPAGALLCGALLCGALALAACRGSEAPAPQAGGDDLQTVDVEPPPDARVDPATDRQERRRAESFSGVLPSGYPSSLPLPAGASLVDQGPRWVEVLVGRAPAGVRDEILRLAAGAGWRVEGGGNALSLHRGGRTVRARLSAQGPSTRLRIEY